MRVANKSLWILVVVSFCLLIAAVAGLSYQRMASTEDASGPEAPVVASSSAETQQVSESSRTASTAPSDGQSEGIQVHGHWVIEVSNPDGTLAKVVEFDNDLDPDSGARHLVAVLGKTQTQGVWGVQVGH